MESVIVVAPCVYDSELRSRISRPLEVQRASSYRRRHRRLVIYDEHNSHVFLSRWERAKEELPVDELSQIEATIPRPVFYLVEYSDIDLCRKVLLAIADDPRLLIDNDFGVRLSGPDFLSLLRARPDWDWRRDI